MSLPKATAVAKNVMLLLVIVTSAEGVSSKPWTEKIVPLTMLKPPLPPLNRVGSAALAPVVSHSIAINV